MIKVPMYIQNKIDRILSLEQEKRKLLREVYTWIENKGIDTSSEDYADSIAVRLENSEFDSSEEFVANLNRFIDGEEVGYG